MPNMCVAYGCSKSPKDNVTVFKFPKDLVCFRKWEQQVQQTRANWHAKPSSDLCSDHFELDCFEVKPFFMLQLGVSLKCPLRLKKGAIPSIFVCPPSVTPGCGQTAGNSKRSTKDDEPTTSCTPKRKRGGVAFEKREHARDAGCQTTKPHGPSRISKRTQTRFCGKDKVRADQPHSKEVSEMEAAHISPELPIRWVVSADRTVEIKEEVTELGCDQANERILQEETPPSSITERDPTESHAVPESEAQGPRIESVYTLEEPFDQEWCASLKQVTELTCVKDEEVPRLDCDSIKEEFIEQECVPIAEEVPTENNVCTLEENNKLGSSLCDDCPPECELGFRASTVDEGEHDSTPSPHCKNSSSGKLQCTKHREMIHEEHIKKFKTCKEFILTEQDRPPLTLQSTETAPPVCVNNSETQGNLKTLPCSTKGGKSSCQIGSPKTDKRNHTGGTPFLCADCEH
ncbi:uncharacterized protein LOC117407687 isoform X2 [Acipenser ruthenus]|uniref:uncharacterized protein LOC117407687 isoform X2 n=1 Tax=Acipenser ruthenus TaxID=7906 RepID=UPI00274201A9|nr:uncharacterized protein LOC117407687 isoform X2 [Acipenser ruthenus]